MVVGETYTVTDGTSEATFTIEGNVTTVGTNTGFGGPGGFGRRGEQNGFGRPDGNNMGGKRDFGGNPPENFDKNNSQLFLSSFPSSGSHLYGSISILLIDPYFY